MKFSHFLAAAAIAFAGSAATAATVQLSADTTEALAGVPGQDFIPQLTAAGATTLYSGNTSLVADGPVRLTFSLVASESGFQNTLLYDGASVVTEIQNGGLADFTTGARANFGGAANSFSVNFFGGDFASLLSFEARDFSAGTTLSFNAVDHEFGVFADSASAGALTSFYLALDDDGAGSDDNHDDIIVRVDVAPVPLPAAGLMLLAGLGGLVGVRRFRRAA